MGLSLDALTRLVASGKIHALRLPDGSLGVSKKRARGTWRAVVRHGFSGPTCHMLRTCIKV
jgi:hypothetical protein